MESKNYYIQKEGISMKIKSAVVNEVNVPYVMEELILSEMREDKFLVKMVASGICHFDDAVRVGHSPYSFPVVLGHEGSGIVEKVCKSIRNFQPGDHVASSYVYCGHCDSCRTGLPASCDSWIALNQGGTREDGSYVFHREDGTTVGNFFGQSSCLCVS